MERLQHSEVGACAHVSESHTRASAHTFSARRSKVGRWRDQLKRAFAAAGLTHEAAGAVIGLARQSVQRLFDPSKERPLTIDHLEALRDARDGRDAWLLFIEEHCAEGGVRVVDTRAGEVAR